MKVVIDESVYLFLKENKIKLSKQMKTVISYLKFNPRMYAMIADDDNAQHFIIKGIDFGYMIYGEVVYYFRLQICKIKYKIKSKIESVYMNWFFFVKATIYLVDFLHLLVSNKLWKNEFFS